MQKFYSIVLMAVALLIGTNTWAVNVNAYDGEGGLKSVIENAEAGATVDITITGDFHMAGTIIVRKGQTINLALGAHKLTYGIENDNTNGTYTAFEIYKGHLNITGTGDNKNPGSITCLNTKTKKDKYYTDETKTTSVEYYRADGGVAFQLGGSADEQAADYATLTIGKGVKVHGNSRGVYFYHTSKETGDKAVTLKAANGKQCSFGTRADISGVVDADRYGIQFSGTLQWVPEEGTNPLETNAPKLYLYEGAEVYTLPTSYASTAVYCGGYGVVIMDGAYVHGSTGVYAKGGYVDIKNTHVASDADTYLQTIAPAANSGLVSTGNAIVIDSHTSYPGNINVKIEGESVIEASEKGTAVEGANTKGDKNKVDNITIAGGTFISGEAGCLEIDPIITAAAGTGENKPTITLTGGNFDADIQDVIDVAANKDVIIGQNVDGGYVITPNESGDPVEKNGPLDGTEKNLAWEGQDRELAAGVNVEIDYLSMGNDASDKPSTLIIRSGATLKVGAIVMSKASVLTVEPGAKLILTQSNGIVANKAENFILQANGTAAAMLLLSPDVKTNRQPMATVEMKTPNAYQIDATNKKWVRFASPMAEVASFASDKATVTHELYEGETTLLTDIEYWDYSKGDWKELKALSEYKPFVMYFLTNNTTSADAIAKNGVKYTFKGKLQGNVTDNIQFGGTNFNYFANTFTAPMGIEALLAQFESNGVVEKTVWVWNAASQSFEDWNLTKIALKKANGFDYAKELSAIESFVCKLPATALNKESINLNYAASVWGYNMGGTSQAAPARVREMNSMKTAQINVLAVDGTRDNVTLIESENFNSEFENGSDASKWMSDEVINLYINGVENLGTIATDNLNGTMLSLQTRDAEQFTLSFSDVAGEGMAIKDMVTGIVTEIKEGNTYQFRADANANNDYRFQIIGVNNAPTDVETIEANEGVSAVYTILGQYVGTSDMINALPAGVYVIDGVKIVK